MYFYFSKGKCYKTIFRIFQWIFNIISFILDCLTYIIIFIILAKGGLQGKMIIVKKRKTLIFISFYNLFPNKLTCVSSLGKKFTVSDTGLSIPMTAKVRLG